MELLVCGLRPAERDYKEGDGKELGLLIFYKLHPLRRREDELRSEINVLVGQITVLREAKAQHEWLDELLFYIIRNKLRPPASCKVKLANLTREDAAKLGGALASLLVSNVTAVAAVDEWIDELLFYILRNKLRPPPSCKVGLADLTREDASKLGASLARLLVYNVTAVAAVDEWIVTAPALTEMDTTYVRERSKS